MIEFILELIFLAIGELIVDILGTRARFTILKMFDHQLNFEEFSQIQSSRHKIFNVFVGLFIFIGLILGILFLGFKFYEK